MNNLGYSNDTLLIGTSRIKGQGQTLIIGDDNNGLGYVLPTEKGDEGQVLTMNADNTTSFQDASPGSLTTKIGSGNNDSVSAAGGTANQGFLPSFSGVRLTDIKNIPPGSSYVIEAQSVVRFTYDGTSPSIISYLQTNLNLTLGGTSSNTATISNQANSNVYPSPVVIGNIYRSYWYYKAVITRSASGSIFFLNTFSTMNRFGDTNYLVNMNTTPNPPNTLAIDGDPNDTTLDFTFQFDNFLGSGTSVTYDEPSINWYISQLGQVSSPALLTNDHTQLTNLNSGDSGHTQFALLQGRNGGQVLSGGITPLHFLTLKSHNIGLNNIVVKDSNTTFEKDIDLDNNSLLNGLGVNTQFLLASSQTETPLIVGSGGGSLAITSNDLTLTENNLPGGEYINFNNTRALTYKTIDMNTNDITNANVIVRASNGNLINFDNDIAPPIITGALTIESGAGKEININADNVLKLNGNSIIHNSGTGPHQFNDSGGLQVQFTSANVEMFKTLDMKNNNIDNVPQVSNSAGVLTLLGTGRTDIGTTAGGGRLEVEDARVFISQFADLNIQDQIIYVQPGTMPTLYEDGKTYIFVGSRSTSTPIVLNNISVTFKGTSRDTSSIEYTGTGSFITATDCNLSISDLELKCNVAGSLLLTASNPSKLKVLSISNCEVIDSYEFSNISGHELVDINNCLFIHLRGDGVLTNQKCLYIDGVAKTNISSCEIVKFFEIGQPANTNPFDGAMIYITGACGAVSIIGGIIHPRVNQRAVEIDNTATFLEFALNTNNFIDIGLTTGAILETNSNASWDTNATAEANSLLPNLKSFVGAQLSAQNTNNTATTLNTPVDINLGTLLTPFAGFGVTVGSGGGVTYNRKRPVNFQVTFVANLQAITGGAGQRIALSTSKNGVNTGIKSFVTLDSAGTEPKQCTLTLIGTAIQGDVFRSQLINETTSSNIRCLDLLVSGIEI